MKIVLFTVIFCIPIIPLYPQLENVKRGNEFYSKGMAYYDSKNYDSLVYYLTKALELRQNHPGMLYNLAAGYALKGNDTEAIKILNRIADMKLYFPVQQDSDFATLTNAGRFKDIRKKFAENIIPIVNSTTAFCLQEKGLLTEGVAYDSQTNNFFVSSVHKRKIMEYDKEGSVREFNKDADTLLGIFGMHVDDKHRMLWAVGGALKNMKGYNENMKGESLLYQFDLQSGNLLAEYGPPEKKADHLFGDLTIDTDGNIYVSDSRYNAIYKLPFNGEELETLVPPGNFNSLQGITLNENDSILFAADYSQGIFKINLHNKSVDLLKNQSATSLLGIDGLYFFNSRLIATQNGINPQRIISLKPDNDLTSISDYKILESNNPQFDEPTLGVIIDNDFYFIANSQWGRFNDDGTILPDEKLDYPLVLKINLYQPVH